MKPIPLQIDLSALQETLLKTLSIEDEVKNTLYELCNTPRTIEEVNFFIAKFDSSQASISRNNAVKQIDISIVDKGIQKAKFLIIEGECDYI